jgi:hypothetical protein
MLVPASPTPLMPSSLLGEGVSMCSSSGSGTSVAYGMRKSAKEAFWICPRAS